MPPAASRLDPFMLLSVDHRMVMQLLEELESVTGDAAIAELVQQLDLARQQGLEGRSKMSKAELAAALGEV